MTPPIERLRYYDGEYLRAFDFAAEQAYHVDMRRRLNMALHLYGIVEGLQLSSITQAGISQVSVSAGMAIDPYGREILLLAPYTFDDQVDVGANRITVDGTYEVWIKYQRNADTPPSNGYAACNVTDQTTRWRETYKIVLLKKSNPVDVPAVTDDISEEDPDTDVSNGVLLGVVAVSPNSTTGAFSLVDKLNNPLKQPELTYVGLRAQRVVCPVDVTGFDVLAKQKGLTPPTSLDLEANVFAQQNLIVGDDFVVDQTKIQPPPKPVAPAVFPNPTGNVKVASDLFLQGNLYRTIGGKWLSFEEQVKALVPDVLVGIFQVTSPSPTDQSNGTFQFSVTSNRLKKIGSASATAAIAAVKWNTILEIFNNIQATDQFLVQIKQHVSASPSGTIDNGCDVQVAWEVAPTFQIPQGGGQPAKYESAIVELWISYVVVCYPPP
jgi:hypothetical protein